MHAWNSGRLHHMGSVRVPAETPETIRTDVVVVGTGAGGAPVAARLAERGLRVVMVESGSHYGADDFTGDEATMTARLWKAEVASGGAMTLYAGECVGGSTVINDAVCLRTPPEVLAQWRTVHGLTGFTDAAFAPWLDQAWEELHATPTDAAHLNRNAQVLARGAAALGWAAEPTPRSVRDCANLGLCNLGCPSNAKQSTLLSHVPRALRAGGQLLANTRVDRLVIANGSVTGVEATRLDPATRASLTRLRIEAPIVCLAAGVLGTPVLLLRSGLRGPVGAGLQFHSSTHVSARFPTPIHGYYGPTMAFAVHELSDVHGHRGPGAMIESTAVQPLATASALPSIGAEHEQTMQAISHLARALVVIHDRTRGTMTLDGARPTLDYPLAPEDFDRLRQGIIGAARVYLAAGASEVFLPLHGVPTIRHEHELRAIATLPLDPTRLSLLYAVHLFGGAIMAGSPSTGVCRQDGRSWQVAGLYVTDAAALPSNVGVNPQITIVANALRIADGIVAQRGHA